MATEKTMKPMSLLMWRVLGDIASGRGTHHNCHGRSEYGGRTTVLCGLRRRGLIDGRDQVTATGLQWLGALEAAQVA